MGPTAKNPMVTWSYEISFGDKCVPVNQPGNPNVKRKNKNKKKQ